MLDQQGQLQEPSTEAKATQKRWQSATAKQKQKQKQERSEGDSKSEDKAMAECGSPQAKAEAEAMTTRGLAKVRQRQLHKAKQNGKANT